MSYKIFIHKLLPYLRGHIGKLVVATLIMTLATVLESSIPELTGRIIDDLFIDSRDVKIVLLYSAGVFGIFFIKTMFTLISISINSRMSNIVMMDLRSDMFAKLLRLPRAYFDQHPSGQTMSKLAYEVGQISNVTSSIWLNFIKYLVLVIILIGYLLYKSWELSLGLIIFLPVVFLIIKLSSGRMRNLSRKVQSSVGSMTDSLNESISGNSLIKIYNAQTQESDKIFNLIKDIRQQRFKTDVTGSLNVAIINILTGFLLGSVIYFSAIYLKMSAGDFIAYFSAMAMLSKPLKSLVNINKTLQIAMAAGESIFGLLDEKEECNNGNIQLENAKGAIKFKNVSFGYARNSTVIDDISLEIRPGETIALVGSTGSGKTTIAQLIAKFYLPNSGTITIDGVDINELEIDSLRAQIAYVDQDVRLFNDTVRGNIAFGQANTMSNAQIQYAAKTSHAYEFIQELSEQFDTKVGENGLKLSGGQRQRLAIARAIAKNSPILILDEATSALDLATERHVQSAINEMQKGRTTIIIAHRLSTIKKADRIIVLQRGKIIEQGTHQDLINAKGEYASLYKY
jgi:subfamily B ATP-binding cassette protein MsbA